MALIPYNKPPLNFSHQISLLESKGMIIEDKAQAESQLACISYYRLSGYWFPFRIRNVANRVTSQFEPNTHFSDAVHLYEFDRSLRSLVLDAIERIEIAIRTQFTYHIGHKYGAFGHTNPNNFHTNFNHAKWIRKLNEETERSSDKFINHYEMKYQGFPNVPIWMLTEVMSLGALSFGYKGLVNDRSIGIEDKKAIADHFDLHYRKLEAWLHSLTYIRNICAHHSRLWNRELAIRPERNNRDPNWLPPITPRDNRIFYILLILRHLLRATGVGDEWASQMGSLLERVTDNRRWRVAMGIPDDWLEHPIWVATP